MESPTSQPVTARCAWEVVAGLLPGRPEPDLTRRFVLSSDDPDERFAELYQQAADYAAGLTDPRHLNWVRLDWVWF